MSLAWLDGELVPEESVSLHVNSVTSALGTGFFEALRCYPTPGGGSAAFRLRDHHRRLTRSLAVVGAAPPVSERDLVSALAALIDAEGMTGAPVYVKVMVYWDVVLQGTSLVALQEYQPRTAIFVRSTAADMFSTCPVVRCRISSWRRADTGVMPPHAKATANYYSARLGLTEALSTGFDNAIFLNGKGTVAEAAESNIFLVDRRARTVTTPTLACGALPGITRDTVLERLRAGTDFEVVEAPVQHTDLYAADEVFLTNTAQIIRGVARIDGRSLGDGAGEVTQAVRADLLDMLFQRTSAPAGWLTSLV
ncbi:aminotransferase class IV [Streptomyces althioticus]|uniref:aminotransferase class IV n=1 Tax=Streptomyces althioticus TaxID=83380 RepID=UPI003690D034